MSRNLVFTSAGDNSIFIKWWTENDSSNIQATYDIYVYYYGDDDEKFNLYKAHSTYAEKSKGVKFQNFYKFWKKFPKVVEDYDRFFILDDDIEITVQDINEMFKISEEYNLLICGPSFSKTSRVSHPHTLHKENIILSYTNFIEVNVPLFTKEAITKLMDKYSPELTEWGVDYLYALVNGIEKEATYAIIHKIQCRNPPNIDKGVEKREIDLNYTDDERKEIWVEYAKKLNYEPLPLIREYDQLFMPIRILVVVLSCQKYSNLWPEILNRGIRDIVILCGGNEKESYMENKIIYLKCNDLYDGLPEKMVCAIDFILKQPEFSSVTHILKADDHDTKFNKEHIDNLEQRHSNILNTHDYIGQQIWDYGNYLHHIGRVPLYSFWNNRKLEDSSRPFCSGNATYILSKKAMMCVNNNFNINNLDFLRKTYVLEDTMMANILYTENIKPFKLNYGISYTEEVPNTNDPQINILVVIISCEKNREKWNEILNRGINNIIIAYGGAWCESSFYNKYLHLACNDKYEGLPEKTISVIDFILKFPKFSSVTHILKLDDNMKFTKQNIDIIINKYSKILDTQHYIGQYIRSNIKRDYHLEKITPYSYWSNRTYEGFIPKFLYRNASYILSRTAMIAINNTFSINNLKYINKTFIYEDVMVGLILKANNIKPYELNYEIEYENTLEENNVIDELYYNNNKAIWIYIGNEGESFTLPLNSHIRFGKDDKWTETNLTTNTFKASSRFFKADPAYGAKKEVHYNINSQIEGSAWIKIGYEDSSIVMPVKGRISFGNEVDGWIEKLVEASTFKANVGFFNSNVKYTHRNIVRLFIQYLW